jgi:amino acid permease
LGQPLERNSRQGSNRSQANDLVSSFPKEEGLSRIGGALVMVSTIIGGGIVGLPFAMYLLGLVGGIALNLGVAYVTFISGTIYLSQRNLIPGTPNSLYEIGYVLQGRKSIFFVASILFVTSVGLMMIYFIVFS